MGLPKICDSLTITDNHRENAIETADVSHCDEDMGRGREQHTIDSRVGFLGEIVAREMINKTDGVTYSDPDDKQHDCFLNGQRVEIKTRKTWNYSNPDLLVRKKFDLAARYYIQLDLYTENGEEPNKDLSNVTRAEIVGFVTKDEVNKYGEDFTPPGKREENETVLVGRNHLRPMHELQARIS